MEDADEMLEINSDTSSDGFLDGWDFSSSSSSSSSSNSSGPGGGGSSSGERGAIPTPHLKRQKTLAQEGKRWTAAALAKARHRTRKHWSRRMAELLQSYRGVYDTLQKAEQINNYESVVEDSTMLDGARFALTTRVIHTVKHFLHLEWIHDELQGGACRCVSEKKGAPVKVKGEGSAGHISDVIGVDLGQLQISKEAWGLMQEEVDADTGRSGKYFGRTEGDGEAGHKVKEVQDAVEVLKTAAADCAVLKTTNDPSTAAVITTVGK
eukprot:g15632.t1